MIPCNPILKKTFGVNRWFHLEEMKTMLEEFMSALGTDKVQWMPNNMNQTQVVSKQVVKFFNDEHVFWFLKTPTQNVFVSKGIRAGY